MSVRIEGVDKLVVKLDGLADGAKVRQGLNKACLIVERAAREKAPKDQGDLKRSIASEVRGTTGVVYTPLEYAPYQEFGTGLFAEDGGRSDVPWRYKDDAGNWHTTSGNPPRPFMRPALNDNRQQVIKAIKEGME
jgi:HK97 gp10 family phage protein